MTLGVYAGVDQPDVASLDYSGATYRCFVYRNIDKGTLESSLFIEQEDGQMVLVDQSIIVTAPPFGEDDELGVDCPRVIGRGQYFIVHYILASTDTIYRQIFDLTDIASAWSTYLSSILAMGTERLYDVAPIGGSDDFVLIAKTTTAATYRIYRVESPYELGDNVFNTTIAIANSDATQVLAVAADDDEERIMLAVEADDLSSDRYLYVQPLDSSDGTSAATAEQAFVGIDADYNHAAVGLCLVEPDVWCVIAEARPFVDYDVYTLDTRHLLWSLIDNDSDEVAGYCEAPGLHLISRPWAWTSSYVSTGVTWGTNVYALVAYKNAGVFSSWEQSYGFVLNLDRRNIGNNSQGIVCSAIMNGSIDGRPTGESDGTYSGDPAYLGGLTAGSGSAGAPVALSAAQRNSWKRINHLSSVTPPALHTLGPNRKTVTMAALFWQRIIPGASVSTPSVTPVLVPSMASVRAVRFYHEDPWMVARDSKEPSLPTTSQYKGAHHRPIAYSTEIAGALVFGGGVTQVFDGAQLCELGFLWAPDIIASNPVHNPAAARFYWYVATYSWTDAKGQLHRSPPSRPVQIGRDDEPTDLDQQVITVRTMTVSLKDESLYYDGASPINIEIWRTYFSGGQIVTDDNPFGPDAVTGTYLFRRVFTGIADDTMNLRSTPENDRTAWSIDITDEQEDAAVQVAELLPFQLDPIRQTWATPPPIPHVPLSVVANWQNRLWGVNPEDSRVIVYSEEILPLGTQYVMPEFNDVGRFRFDSRGEITALQPMDNALIVFTRESIYALAGTPSSGGGLSSLEIRTLHEGVGCIEPRSVVLGHPGIFFQSAKGYYLLGRGLEVDYETSAPVEDLIRAAGNVRGATLLEDRHQIRLVLNGATRGNPTILLYDYFHRLWSTALPPQMGIAGTGANPRFHDMQSATWWRGIQGETLHVFLQQGGGIGVERAQTDTVFADQEADEDLVPIPMDVTVEWIHLAGIAGYKKLGSIGIQLEKVDDVRVQVDLYYDINGDYDETSPDDTFYDLAAAGYVRIRPSIRKCSAVLIRVVEYSADGGGAVPQTENLKITGLTLEVGIKKGPRRVPDTRVGAAS